MRQRVESPSVFLYHRRRPSVSILCADPLPPSLPLPPLSYTVIITNIESISQERIKHTHCVMPNKLAACIGSVYHSFSI